MHELSLMNSILDIAQEHAQREQARSIRTIALRVGALSGVDPQALEFAFEAARIGTMAQEARLEVEYVPLVAYCQPCDQEFGVDSPFAIALCPFCGEPTAVLRQGEELEVKYLEVL